MDDDVSSAATVLGLDNIPLELPVAGAGSRAPSAALDYLIVGILTILWGAGCPAPRVAARVGWWALGLFVVGFFVIEYGYFAGVEIARERADLRQVGAGTPRGDARARVRARRPSSSATPCAAWT